jgi:hypothetical protein
MGEPALDELGHSDQTGRFCFRYRKRFSGGTSIDNLFEQFNSRV